MSIRPRIRLDKARKDGYGFRLQLDNERSKYDCSIKHVYGVCDTFFGKQVSIVPANQISINHKNINV